MKKMRQNAVMGLILAGAVLAGCGKPGERVLFNGNYYPAKVKKDGEIANFVVTVRNANQGVAGAREAGRYWATDYCIKKFGDSAIAWGIGPDGEAAQVNDAGALVMNGTCNQW